METFFTFRGKKPAEGLSMVRTWAPWKPEVGHSSVQCPGALWCPFPIQMALVPGGWAGSTVGLCSGPWPT